MADQRVTVELKVKLEIRVDDGTDISEVLDEMEYSFTDTTDKATVEDHEILDYEVKDSH